MTAVAVAADNLRADPMDTTVNTGGIGGGAGEGIETDVYYQNDAAISRKVTAHGFFSDTGAQRDMTVTGRKTWLVKCAVTNYGGVTNLELRLGTAAGVYWQYIIANNTTKLYPPKGGFLILAIDPSAGYEDSAVGGMIVGSNNVLDYFGIYCECSTSKAENLVMDAIDIGYGLYLTGGDGADADGVFQDFVDNDEGDSTNGRFGYVTTNEGVLNVLGKLIIGATSASGVRTASATVFVDAGQTVVFPDNMAAAGFSGLELDLGNATTDISLAGNSYVGRGNTTTTDTRPTLEVFGTSGVANVGAPFTNFASFLLTSACSGAMTIKDSGLCTVAGADIAGTYIEGCTASSALLWNTNADPNGELDNLTAIMGGTNSHVIELGSNTPSTITLTGHSYTGYNATTGSNLVANSGPTDAAIYNNSGKAITINITNGASPSVRNGVGATTTVVTGQITLSVTVLDDVTGNPIGTNCRVQLVKSSNKAVLLNKACDVNGIASEQISYDADTDVEGWAREMSLSGTDYVPKDISGQYTSSGFSVTVRLEPIT